MFEICIRSRFAAAHHLRGYQGNCESVHGHNWEVEVYVRGTELDATGILIDFRVLRRATEAVLASIDHSDLNAHPAFQTSNPSSEHLARFIFRELALKLGPDKPCKVHKVIVKETPDAIACYWDEPLNDRNQSV